MKKNKSKYEALALVLLVAGLAEFFLWLWQFIFIPANLFGYLNLAFCFFDFYLSYSLFKNRPGIKKQLFLRIILGLGAWLCIFYLLGTHYGLIWPKAAFLITLSVLAMDKLRKTALLAILSLIFLFADFYFTAGYITYKQNLLVKVKKQGKKQFISKNYNYRLSAPAGWKIIKRADFLQIKEKFLKTQAEAALISEDGKSFCLIIPEKNASLIQSYPMQVIKEALTGSLKAKKTVKINRVSDFISKKSGFQIQYTDIIDDSRQDYLILVLRKKGVDLKIIGWTLRADKEKIYRRLKKITRSIEGKSSKN